MQNFLPASAMVAHTTKNFVKNNLNHSQTAGPGRKPTVIPTCSFIAEKKGRIFARIFAR